MTALAPTLEAFFTDRLIRQRQVSTHSVIAYRDTFRLLLGFAQSRTGRAPSTLNLEDLDAALISAFLDHLEVDRHNKTRTRNARLAAVHSLFRFAALRHPENSALIQRVLAMPPKRYDRTIVAFLDRGEVDALLAARHTQTAAHICPSLRSKAVSPHVFRHTAAMRLLHAGVDPSTIALWLGHERVESTQIYIHADQTLKERALARTTPLGATAGRYRPPDTLLAFLEQLR